MDNVKWQRFLELYFEKLSPSAPISIEIPDLVTIDTTAGELQGILVDALHVVPGLRQQLYEALGGKKGKMVKSDEECQGETLTYEPPKWEYRYFHSSDTDTISKCGAEGWEAVLIDPDGDILFKRPI